jgi:hypothetical protein
LPLLVASSDCLPADKVLTHAMTLTNRKIIHSMQNPLGCAVRKQGSHNHQVKKRLTETIFIQRNCITKRFDVFVSETKSNPKLFPRLKEL